MELFLGAGVFLMIFLTVFIINCIRIIELVRPEYYETHLRNDTCDVFPGFIDVPISSSFVFAFLVFLGLPEVSKIVFVFPALLLHPF